MALIIIGWLSIGAGLFLAVIGRARFIRLMSWALSLPEALTRVGGILQSVSAYS